MGGKLSGNGRIPREESGRIIGTLIAEISDLAERYEVCGSYRRQKPTCGDGDIALLVPDDFAWKEILERLGCDPLTKAGTLRKGAIVIRDGFQIDIGRARTVPEFESMVLTMTGSAEWNIACRAIAKRKGLLLNQYGLFHRETGERVASGERGILSALGVKYVEPSGRTGWDAIEKEAR